MGAQHLGTPDDLELRPVDQLDSRSLRGDPGWHRTVSMGAQMPSRTRVESAWPSSARADDVLGDSLNDVLDRRGVER